MHSLRHRSAVAAVVVVGLALPAPALAADQTAQAGGKLVVPQMVSTVPATAGSTSDGESWTNAGIVSAATVAVALAFLLGVTRIKRAPIAIRGT